MKRFTPPSPRSPGLYGQIIGLITVVLLLGALASASYSKYRLEQKNRQSTQQQALALANGAASSSRDAFIINDLARQEQALTEFAKLPGVLSAEIVSLKGVSTFRVQADGRGVTHTQYQRRQYTPPAIVQPVIQRSSDDQRLHAWYPMNNNQALAWVRLEISLQEEHISSKRLWVDAMLGGIGITIVTVLILLWYLRRALDPVHRAAMFAKRLATSAGETFEVKGTSREVEALEQALNFASLTLKSQYDSLGRRDAEMRAVLGTAADAVIGLDQHGCVRLFNPAATSIFGPDAEQMMGRPISDIIPSLNAEQLARLLAEGSAVGGSALRIARTNTNGVRNGDVEFPIEIALAEVAASSMLRYTLIARDVTEQRMANEHLQIYVRALECSSHGAVICDARLPGAPMVWVNSAFSRISGYDQDELSGRNCSFLQGVDRQQPEIEQLRRAIRLGQPCQVLLRNYRKNGELFWNQLAIAPVADDQGLITHFVGAVSDITSRVLAEQAIEQRKEQLDLILRLSPDGFVMFDRDDHFVYANTSFIHMTGIPVEKFNPQLTPSALEHLLQTRADPKLPWDVIWRETADDEQSRQMVMLWPERRILSFDVKRGDSSGDRLLFVRDITRESEVDRMKSEFLSTAAHELRTPLVSILGYSELLLHRQYTPERSKTMLETIHRQAGLIVNLINELLDLARIEARQGKDFHIQNTALQPIIDEAVTSLVVPGDTRSVRLNLPSAPVYAAVDNEKLRQALMNVLSNAYKYSPQGGDITLDLLMQYRRGMDMAGIRVSDQGMGMTPEQLARAFERFFRADPSGNIPGTGLGLCIVKEIIELLGGDVELHSIPGQGTEVTLWLPMRSGDETAASETSSAEPA